MNNEQHRAACALIGSEVPISASEIMDELRDVQEQLLVLDAALRVQRERVHLAKTDADQVICARLVPQHQAMARRLLDNIKATLQVLNDEKAWRDLLEDKGVLFQPPLFPIAFPKLRHFLEAAIIQFERGEESYRYKLS